MVVGEEVVAHDSSSGVGSFWTDQQYWRMDYLPTCRPLIYIIPRRVWLSKSAESYIFD